MLAQGVLPFKGQSPHAVASHRVRNGTQDVFLRENPLFLLKSTGTEHCQLQQSWAAGTPGMEAAFVFGFGTWSSSLVPHLDSALEPDLHHVCVSSQETL